MNDWFPVVGFESLYGISDRGRVFAFERFVYCRDGRVKKYSAHELCLHANEKGHLWVWLTPLEGSKVKRYVHHLMLETFVGPRPPGMMGLHWDDDPANNLIENLRWGTRSDNSLDCVRNGTHYWASKERCGRGHLLAYPNLRLNIKNGQAVGRGSCLSCRRGIEDARRHKRRGDENYVQYVTDLQYAKLGMPT